MTAQSQAVLVLLPSYGIVSQLRHDWALLAGVSVSPQSGGEMWDEMAEMAADRLAAAGLFPILPPPHTQAYV